MFYLWPQNYTYQNTTKIQDLCYFEGGKRMNRKEEALYHLAHLTLGELGEIKIWITELLEEEQ